MYAYGHATLKMTLCDILPPWQWEKVYKISNKKNSIIVILENEIVLLLYIYEVLVFAKASCDHLALIVLSKI